MKVRHPWLQEFIIDDYISDTESPFVRKVFFSDLRGNSAVTVCYDRQYVQLVAMLRLAADAVRFMCVYTVLDAVVVDFDDQQGDVLPAVSGALRNASLFLLMLTVHRFFNFRQYVSLSLSSGITETPQVVHLILTRKTTWEDISINKIKIFVRPNSASRTLWLYTKSIVILFAKK